MNNAPDSGLQKTRKRVLTRRGVLWLGQTCNQRCYFCYFINRIEDHKHPEHPFMTLDKARKICDVLRHFYGNTAIDIQGGEPTLHHDILALVRHCRDIGLYPTLITNGLMLARPGVIEDYRDAGLRDFLVSLHGVGDVHDTVVGVKKAYARIQTALDRMRALRFPFRFNCTMSKPVAPLLVKVARHAVDYGASAVNYIAFNPFADQEAGRRRADTVPRYQETAGPLAEALDLLEANDIEGNVRYLPLCIAQERHRKNFYNFQQLPYDTHEWDFQSWTWTMSAPQMRRDGGASPPFLLGGPYSRGLRNADAMRLRDRHDRHPYVQALKFKSHALLTRLAQRIRGLDAVYREEGRYRAAHDCLYAYHEACRSCAARNICDGFHGDYASMFGTSEAAPIQESQCIDDPLYYIREQEKTVEPEDASWAL